MKQTSLNTAMKDTDAVVENGWLSKFHFVLFMIMGSGANWVFATALTLEIPYFENHQPEGLCIATYMNASNNLGILAVMIYLFVHTYYYKVPYYYSVPSLLAWSSLGCFLAAAVYPIVVNNVSLLIFLCSWIGGCIGALSNVIMNPFMTQYKNLYISAARSGGSAYILLTALVSIAQNPGASDPRFSVAAYMCIFGVVLIPPLFAYRYITVNKIGLRDANAASVGSHSFDLNPIVANNGMDDETAKKESRIQAFEVENPAASASSSGDDSNDEDFTSHTDASALSFPGKPTLDRWMSCFTHFLVSESYHKRHPWLREAIPYMMTVAWVDFNTWGVMTAMMPFAMSNASPNGGSGSAHLAIAYQVGAVMLVCGDFSTAFFQLPKFYAIVVYTAIVITLYSCALGSPSFQTEAAAPILIFIFGIQRFTEAHLLTSSYRSIATRFPLKYRQIASRSVGTADQVFTTLGAVLSTLVVSVLFKCGNTDD